MFDRIPPKILCFPAQLRFQRSSISSIGSFEPYGTVWNHFQRFEINSVEFRLKFRVFQKRSKREKYCSESAMTHAQLYLDHLEPFLKFLKKVPRKMPSFRVAGKHQYQYRIFCMMKLIVGKYVWAHTCFLWEQRICMVTSEE